MANHIQVSVTFLCEDDLLQEILESIQCDYTGENSEHGIGTIDFNKIVPMPKSLDIESGSKTDEGIQLYLTAINPAVTYFGLEKLPLLEFQKLMKHTSFRKFKPLTPEQIENLRSKWPTDELLSYGKTCVENIRNYGAPTWYQWCYENWGTKWNGYDFCHASGSHTISFTTANGIPDPVFEQLSALYKDVEIILNWGGYWAGGCGEVRFKNGQCILDEFHGYHEVTVDVPSILGYPNDQYSLMFTPGFYGIDINDHLALLRHTLKSAIKDAERKGRIPKGYFDDAAFEQALKDAMDMRNERLEAWPDRNRCGIPATS